MPALEKELRAVIQGDVSFKSFDRHAYSVDASIYEVEPIGIVWPRNRDDVVRAVRIAHKHGVPIVGRGAGTGIVGGCIGPGLIIDCSKYLTRIHHIDLEQETVLCDPGVVQDRLNEALSADGYRFGPDTSTGNRATLGGMVANNSAGAYSLKYGKTVDHILECELILANGEAVYFGEVEEVVWKAKLNMPGTEGQIYRTLDRIRKELFEEIVTRYPKIPRRVSGYNLDELIKPFPLNVCKIIAGSEGSLGILTRLKLRISPRPHNVGLCLIHYHELLKAFETVPQLLSHKPLALEVMDGQVIEMGRLAPALRGKLGWLKDNPQALFVAAFEGADAHEAREKTEAFAQYLQKQKIGYAHSLLFDPQEMANVWALRKSGLGLLLARRSYSRAVAFIEDLSVNPARLAPLMRELEVMFDKYDKKAGVYGHAGPGCIHVRPYVDMGDAADLQVMKEMMEEAADLALALGGSLSGEHGDGYTRSWLNKKLYGDKVYQAFIDLKQAFDPSEMMNPGKVVASQGFLENLRFSPDTKIQLPESKFSYEAEGGFHLAIDMCNGNGQCRKKEGIMCPSFQATGDERHSTRARAQALRAIVNGRVALEEISSKELQEVLDLCLECKGCKTECPSQVDMAKLKSEVLYHYNKAHGSSIRSRLFAQLPLINRVGSALAPLSNWIAGSSINRWLLSKLGISPDRPLPPFATERFSVWLKKQHNEALGSRPVVLLNDSYSEFNYPEIGKAAVRVLRALDCQVQVPPWSCCGRPLISKGFLDQAQDYAQRLVNILYPYAKEGLPIIGLEPSCLSALQDDYLGLIPGEKTQVVAKAALSLDQYLAKLIDEDLFQLNFKDEERRIKVHGHCHQKALTGMSPTMKVLKALPRCSCQLIDSGCCGVAGSFAYEAEHDALSRQIAELKLLPTIRNSHRDTLIVANGLSCRSQIQLGVDKRAYHLAQLLDEALL